MKKETIDFDKAKDDLQRLFDSRFVKVAAATVIIVVIIYVAGQVMRVVTTTVIQYKAMSNAMRIPVAAPKISA